MKIGSINIEVGTLVRCIKPVQANLGSALFIVGSAYVVSRIDMPVYGIFVKTRRTEHLFTVKDFSKYFELFYKEKGKDMKFKVGDKVRCINIYYDSTIKIGQEYTVTRLITRINETTIAVDDDDNNGYGYFHHRFELVKENKMDNELQELVDTANTGLDALGKLYTDHLDEIAVKDSVYTYRDIYEGTFHKSYLHFSESCFYKHPIEVKPAPAKVFKPFYINSYTSRGEEWLVKIVGKNIIIGCEEFDAAKTWEVSTIMGRCRENIKSFGGILMKKGDKVRCIDDKWLAQSGIIAKGNVYTIEDVDKISWISLEGIKGGFLKDRFVMCSTGAVTQPNFQVGDLVRGTSGTFGTVYKIVELNSKHVKLAVHNSPNSYTYTYTRAEFNKYYTAVAKPALPPVPHYAYKRVYASPVPTPLPTLVQYNYQIEDKIIVEDDRAGIYMEAIVVSKATAEHDLGSYVSNSAPADVQIWFKVTKHISGYFEVGAFGYITKQDMNKVRPMTAAKRDTPKTCQCTMQDLMIRGCNCGGK